MMNARRKQVLAALAACDYPGDLELTVRSNPPFGSIELVFRRGPNQRAIYINHDDPLDIQALQQLIESHVARQLPM